MSTYVWCEDSSSGYFFWKNLFSVLYNEFVVESKKSNSNLCNEVSKISQTDENRYYILLDNAIDNPEVLREVIRLKKIIKEKENVTIIKIHSFEFVLLSFKMLEDWVFAEVDELKDKRTDLLYLKDVFVKIILDGGDVGELSEMKNLFNIDEMINTEQLASKLLYKITRNTGFETNKGKLGDCFVVDCCDWNFRESDDICGLDDHRISAKEKIENIFEYSVLKHSFTKAGL